MNSFVGLCLLALLVVSESAGRDAAQVPVAAAPAKGSKAPDFTLAALDGTQVKLSTELARGPVVLIVGRGYPGYQCPFCTRQFGELRARAQDIEAHGARVLWVYPGPAQDLTTRATAFISGTDVPPNFRLLLDADYRFTLAYGLRWNAPSETAYPASFVIDRSGVVRFVHVSREHGGRTPVTDILAALSTL